MENEEPWTIWLAEGDENTKFFQNYAKHRKNINIIWELRKEDVAEEED